MIVTISGLPGSGKSTVGRMLAKKLGYKFYSMGDLRGKMAMERGLTIDELNKLGEREAWTDRQIDDYLIKLGKTKNNFVIDGRLAFHFVSQAFKIFLTIDPKEAARRVFKNPRPDEPKVKSMKELQTIMAERVKSDERRYKKYYQVNFQDPHHYNLILDTTKLRPKQIIAIILEKLEAKTT